MLEYYFTDGDIYAELDRILKAKLDSYTILRTKNGKPYLEGNPLFFSISHSSGRGGIAISDKPVGVDIEVIKDRNFRAVARKFSAIEQSEINCLEDFLKHWVIREAYIKMKGLTLSEKLFKCEYFGGTFYVCGQEACCRFISGVQENLIWCICIDNK